MDNEKIKLGTPRNDGQLSMIFNKGGAREGAGRKRLGITKKVSLTLPEELWETLQAVCTENNTSQSEVLRSIISSYFTKK